jgi:hypothetical protein
MSKGEIFGNSNYSHENIKDMHVNRRLVNSGKNIVLPWRVLFPRNVILWKII